MCTAVAFVNGDSYFGRNLDLDMTYGERVVITPREFAVKFLNGDVVSRHYAIIGMANIVDGYPLYFDGTNEKGLSCAALNFTGNAVYKKGKGKGYIASYEFILWVLSLCDSVSLAREKIKKIKISDTPFSAELPPAGLHFIVSDKSGSITVEQTEKGLKIYENPIGVLTNNPVFPMHLMYLNNFAALSCKPPENNFSSQLKFTNYSNGLGAFSLPGDFSSMSRFVRAAFVKSNSVCEETEEESVAHFFHILDSVAVPSGSVILPNGNVHKTVYSSCCNASKGVYYYKTYNDLGLNFADMHDFDLDGKELIEA